MVIDLLKGAVISPITTDKENVLFLSVISGDLNEMFLVARYL
jgi:hypothetical protein